MSAGILMILPIAVAADFGGVLWWTQYVSALAVSAAALLATAVFFDRTSAGNARRFALLLPLALWASYAWFQSLPMSPSIVDSLSPGSGEAYTDWIAPFVPPSEMPSRFPISLDRFSTQHAAAVLTLLIGLVWASLAVFKTRSSIAVFLSVTALGAAAHAAFGVYRTINPESNVWDVTMGSGAFGTFVNRNNAALLLNLGMAASLGLLAWRLTALTGQEVDDPTFEINDLVALVSDRESLIGVIGVVFCLSGIMICGSRGGIVSAIGGFLLALGWVRQRRGLMTIPVVVAAVAAGILLLIVPLRLSLESFKSFNLFSGNDRTTLLRDGRLTHWRDGWETAVAHLPSGSGLSTYAYAYLPFQQSGSRSWYHHADNLWLEMFTEQGIVGVLLSLWVLAILVGALSRMGNSADAIDHGLRVAGWYALGAILISQIFDFGLIIPANLYLTVILFSIILARDDQTRTFASEGSRPSLFRRKRSGLASTIAAVVAGIATFVAVTQLEQDARRDALIKTAEAHFDDARSDTDKLASWTSRIQQAIANQSWPEANDLLCEFEFQGLRVKELIAANPQTVEEAKEVYEATGPVNRRLQWRQVIATEQDATDKVRPAIRTTNPRDPAYQVILSASASSLVDLPLGLSSRTWQLYLDFVHDDAQRSEAALSQLSQIYRRDPHTLIILATFAGDGGDYPQATELLKSALKLAPLVTVTALKTTQRWDQISAEDILEEDPMTWRAAASFVLKEEAHNEGLLRKCIEKLRCDQCESNAEKSGCQRHAAKLAYSLKDYDLAFENYHSAVGLTPDDANMRYEYITRLKESGRRDQARSQAQNARENLPLDVRFDRFIQDMAKEDLLPTVQE
jgi:tetratricopeptide (TPR) repeat protein